MLSKDAYGRNLGDHILGRGVGALFLEALIFKSLQSSATLFTWFFCSSFCSARVCSFSLSTRKFRAACNIFS